MAAEGKDKIFLGGDHARALFIAFVGLHLHQIVKGAVLNVSDVDQVLKSVVEKGGVGLW